MFKVMIASTRRKDFSRDQFFSYMQQTHAPMAIRCESISKNVAYAIQHRTHLPEEGVTAATLYAHRPDRDAVVELVHSHPDKFMTVMNDREYIDKIRTDEANFAILEENLLVYADEYQAIADRGGQGDGVKLYDYLRRRPNMGPAEFQQAWREHGERLAANPEVRRLVRQRIHNFPVLGHPTAVTSIADFDGIACTVFDNWEDADTFVRSGLGEGEKRIVHPEKSFTLYASGRKVDIAGL